MEPNNGIYPNTSNSFGSIANARARMITKVFTTPWISVKVPWRNTSGINIRAHLSLPLHRQTSAVGRTWGWICLPCPAIGHAARWQQKTMGRVYRHPYQPTGLASPRRPALRFAGPEYSKQERPARDQPALMRGPGPYQASDHDSHASSRIWRSI